jgi:hypothetical protein
MTRYWKSIIAAVIAVLVILVQAIQAQSADGVWTGEDTIVTILVLLSAVGVYFKANTLT